MMNKRITAAALCCILVLGGCGNGRADEKEQEEGIQTEAARQDGGGGQETGENSVDVDRETGENSVDGDQTAGSAQVGAVVIESGPDRQLYAEGSLIYTLHDFNFYESPEDASVAQDELLMADAEYYADRSKFLTFQVDINNIDYAGDNNDGQGEMNISFFAIAPHKPDEALQWAGSYPVYLSEHGKGETDYYHVWVKPGETKTVTAGFFVPVKDAGELRSQCIIALYGSYDEGYVYEIPDVQ